MTDTSEDIKAGAEQFSGNELNEVVEEEDETTSEEEDQERPHSPKKGRRGVWVGMAVGLFCLLIGVGYLYWERAKPAAVPHREKRSTAVGNVGSLNDYMLVFDPFVIPFKGGGEYTYLLLSISLKLPNKQLKREITEVKEQIRGILYDALKEEINKTEDIPSVQELKDFLSEGLDVVLNKGKVDDVYITKFLAL
jgi:flagellar basal body-associated protein FliL